MATASAARLLPSVDELLRQPALAAAEAELGHEIVLRAVRRTLQRQRDVALSFRASSEESVPDAAHDGFLASLGMTKSGLAEQAANLARQTAEPSLRPLINATGVVIHTNLGRAPLCRQALDAMAHVALDYSNLEFDLAGGGRGDRQDHIQRTLGELLGTEAALVVNNNASAVLLALTALARGKEMIVSRGQAVEIGGGFRIPDVMRRSGAKLVEVGTTNRTYVRDYEQAIGEKTAALMRVHPSNFRVSGFTQEVDVAELGELARSRGVLLVDDLGSGALIDTSQFGLAREPMVQHSLAAGADVVCFSGDKLLGGPQAGIIVGRRAVLDRLKRDPLMRAMRTDKLTLAALNATLLEYLKGRALQTIPVWRMIACPIEELRRRAEAWAARLPGAAVIGGRSAIGGGSLAEETLPTALLRLPLKGSANRQLAGVRREGVVARIEDGAVVLDPRTVLDDDALLRAIEGSHLSS